MRQAKLGQYGIENEAERLRTILNLGLDVLTDDLGGVDFTTTTTGSWQDTGLTITLTPTRDVRAVALARFGIKHSAATANVQARIVSTGALTPVILWSELTPNANKWVSGIIWGIEDLTAGVAYTFKVQTYCSTAGTLTVSGGTTYTQLAVVLAHKAALT